MTQGRALFLARPMESRPASRLCQRPAVMSFGRVRRISPRLETRSTCRASRSRSAWRSAVITKMGFWVHGSSFRSQDVQRRRKFPFVHVLPREHRSQRDLAGALARRLRVDRGTAPRAAKGGRRSRPALAAVLNIASFGCSLRAFSTRTTCTMSGVSAASVRLPKFRNSRSSSEIGADGSGFPSSREATCLGTGVLIESLSLLRFRVPLDSS